jgi:hypothetical protein
MTSQDANTINPVSSPTMGSVFHAETTTAAGADIELSSPSAPSVFGSYSDLLQLIGKMPLLTQQALYVTLRASLESNLSAHTLEKMDTHNLLQLWVPQMTHIGMQTLIQLNNQNNSAHPLFQLLKGCQSKQTVAQTTTAQGWTLYQICMLLQQACQKEWIVLPTSTLILAAIHFITGQIRLGEFLMRMGKISSEQLDQALKTQQYAWEVMGQRSAIGNILVNLGYASKEDIEGILLMKQQSKLPMWL